MTTARLQNRTWGKHMKLLLGVPPSPLTVCSMLSPRLRLGETKERSSKASYPKA